MAELAKLGEVGELVELSDKGKNGEHPLLCLFASMLDFGIWMETVCDNIL